MLSYAPFFKMLEKKPHLTTYYLIHKKGINPNTLTRIKRGKPITTETLDQLCEACDCEVYEVIERVKQ